MTTTKPRFSYKPLLGVCRWHSADSQAPEGYRSTGLLKGSSELGNRLVDFLNRAPEPEEKMESLALALAMGKDRFADDVVREWLDSQERQEKPSCDEDGVVIEAPEKADTITISAGDASVSMTLEDFDRVAAEIEASGAIPHPVQIPGKALHALIKEFCEPFDKKGGSQPTHSVGLGSSSIVATDRNRAILLGELESGYRTTDYRRTMVEGDWSKRMDEPVRWDALPEMGQTTDIDNPVLPGIEIEGPQYPQIGAVIDRHSLEGMVEIAGFDPQMLVAVGRVADSLGAVTVTLFHDGEGKMMGFKFEASPTIGSGENEVICQPFPVQGLLCARAKGSKEKGEEGGE